MDAPALAIGHGEQASLGAIRQAHRPDRRGSPCPPRKASRPRAGPPVRRQGFECRIGLEDLDDPAVLGRGPSGRARRRHDHRVVHPGDRPEDGIIPLVVEARAAAGGQGLVRGAGGGPGR